MPYITNITTTTDIPDSVKQAYDSQFIMSSTQENVLEQFAIIKDVVGAEAITIDKVDNLTVSIGALDEDEEAASSKLSTSKIVITPAEHGKVISRTNLANIITGGLVDLAATRNIAIHYGRYMDTLAIQALDASSNAYIVGGTAEGSVAGTDVASLGFLNYFYNKLARASVPTIDGSYVMVAHEDVIADLRVATTAGSWQDVVKYTSPGEALRNEVGMYGGFRIIRDNNCTYADQSGAGTVDIYNSYFFGANALAKGISQPVSFNIKPAGDALNRFVTFGWYEVCAYKILDTDAVWKGRSASSVGQNS